MGTALAGVAQWIEYCACCLQKGHTGLIPGPGTCLGCPPGSRLGLEAFKRQQIDVSLSTLMFSLPLFLPLFPSL